MTQNGSCRCGAVSYRLAQAELPQTYGCHCLDCQSWSGSAFALHALLPEGSLQLEGPLTSYSLESEAGIRSEHWACSRCYTRIFNPNDAVPGIVILRAETLVDSQSLEPAAHIWTRRKQGWLRLPSDVPAFETTPSPAAFASAVSRRSSQHKS